jgi:hypothetical protein
VSRCLPVQTVTTPRMLRSKADNPGGERFEGTDQR